MQSINSIVLKMVKVSKLLQRKLIPYKSIIGLGLRKILKIFWRYSQTAIVHIGI